MKKGIYSWAANPSDLLRRVKNANPKLAADLGSLELDWYSIRNTAEDTTDVYIYDVIGGWFGVEASSFVRELNDISTSNINVRINSPGGDVYDSIALYNAILVHPANVTVYIDSLAASGASVIAMAGEKVVMMPGSQMMIHDALIYTAGNAAQLREDAAFLDRQSDNIAGFYATKAGGTPDEWRARMLAETWMFAQEAVELGLADEIYSVGEDADPDELGGDGGDAAQLHAKLSFSHPLANRGFAYAGRQRAPQPTPAPQRARKELTDEELINLMVGGK